MFLALNEPPMPGENVFTIYSSSNTPYPYLLSHTHPPHSLSQANLPYWPPLMWSPLLPMKLQIAARSFNIDVPRGLGPGPFRLVAGWVRSGRRPGGGRGERGRSGVGVGGSGPLNDRPPSLSPCDPRPRDLRPATL